MLIAEVGKPPNIAEPHSVAETGEEEVALVVPGAPLGLHRDLRVDLGDLLLAPTLAHGGVETYFFGLKLELWSLVCRGAEGQCVVWSDITIHLSSRTG